MPSEAAHAAGFAFHGEASHVIRADLDPQHRIARSVWHRIQPRQSAAARLEQGFGARPDFKEMPGPLLRWQSAQGPLVFGCKVVLGEAFDVRGIADSFEIDADLAGVRDGEQHEIARVAEIEAEQMPRESRLSVRAHLEGESRGELRNVAGEDESQAAMRGDKFAPVLVEVKAFGANPFFGRERGLHGRARLADIGQPDVDFTRREAEAGGGALKWRVLHGRTRGGPEGPACKSSCFGCHLDSKHANRAPRVREGIGPRSVKLDSRGHRARPVGAVRQRGTIPA